MSTHAAAIPSQARHFIVNVLWSWAGVMTTIAVAALISPYIIRTIGDTNYSIWSLALSVVEYFWLIDLGLRSATVKYSAEFRTLGEERGTSELLSTGLVVYTFSGLLIACITLIIAPRIGPTFHIDNPVFPVLVMLVGLSWSVGLVFNLFGAALEGCQRFDIPNRIWITGLILRSIGTVVVLHMGFGLLQMGIILFCTQFLTYILTYIGFRSVLPHIIVSWTCARWSMLKTMVRYGVPSFTVLISTRLLTHSVPFLIAYFLPVRFLAYYTVPMRILDYALDGIGRVGMVTTPNATELMASGRSEQLVGLGVYANRYSLTLFAPVTMFLLAYGFELYSQWIRPDFAGNSAYLLPAMLLGPTIIAGQFNSVSILFGLGSHKTYSRMLLLESILAVTGMVIALPRFGLYGAAWVASSLASLDRGVIVCLLTARELGIRPAEYAARIYTRPLALAFAVLVALFGFKRIVPGNTRPQLVAAVLFMGALYVPLAMMLCVESHHRAYLLERVRRVLLRSR
jgi:O-antigen/teichoic acid export membrane protein